MEAPTTRLHPLHQLQPPQPPQSPQPPQQPLQPPPDDDAPRRGGARAEPRGISRCMRRPTRRVRRVGRGGRQRPVRAVALGSVQWQARIPSGRQWGAVPTDGRRPLDGWHERQRRELWSYWAPQLAWRWRRLRLRSEQVRRLVAGGSQRSIPGCAGHRGRVVRVVRVAYGPA